jgi:hypothetical protein
LILDTNALSAMADGEPELEPIVRDASELILRVIVWASIGSELPNCAFVPGTKDGEPQRLRPHTRRTEAVGPADSEQRFLDSCLGEATLAVSDQPGPAL